MQKILVTPGSFGKYSQEPERILINAGLEIIKYTKSGMTEDEVIEQASEVDAMIIGLEPITAKVIDACKQLKVIAKFGVGLDNIDLIAARAKNIEVVNTPGANSDAVADFTLGLMLALARAIPIADRDMKDGQWNKYTGYSVSGATLGIIGLGAIGKKVAERAKGFSMKIMAYDIFWDEAYAIKHNIQKASIEEICKECDFISLHTALTDETKNMISMKEMRLMKKSAFIINCARGGLINEEDLYQMLMEGAIAGAGLDTFSVEPMKNASLLKLNNVVVAPHIAGSTIGSIINMGVMSAQRCVETLNKLTKDNNREGCS